MLIWVIFFVYVLISATGLFLIKIGADSTYAASQNGLFILQVSPKLFIGLVLYVCSFLLSIFIMSKMKLSVFYPVGTGTILILTCLFGYYFLKENIGMPQMIGIILILCGVVAMNIK